jgi:hypothetical protein
MVSKPSPTALAAKLELQITSDGDFVASYEFDTFEDMNAFLIQLGTKTKGRMTRLMTTIISEAPE